MGRRPTARELTARAAAGRRPPPSGGCPPGEVAAMLARRGFHPTPAPPDLPFPPDLDPGAAERLRERLGHYGFRLFLRGAIQRPGGFLPGEATRYLTPAQSRALAEGLVELGLAARLPRRRYRLLFPARSFGGTLEWYVGRELRRRLGFDVATGLQFRARGVGGDLDVVAAAEGKLVYLELKSSPPRQLSPAEVSAFFDRLRALRPDVGLFVMDTALRLSDKVVPMLAAELERRGAAPASRVFGSWSTLLASRRLPDPNTLPRRVERELWALGPHLYAVNARPDLLANIGRAIAEGFRALSPGLLT